MSEKHFLADIEAGSKIEKGGPGTVSNKEVEFKKEKPQEAIRLGKPQKSVQEALIPDEEKSNAKEIL